jgi:enediyne biosynthesis protein E4
MNRMIALLAANHFRLSSIIGSLMLSLQTAIIAGDSASNPTLAALTPRQPTPPISSDATDWFVDVTQAAQIDFVHQFCHRRIANILLSNGAGAAVFDYDHDGWMDLYFLNWGPLDGVTQVPRDTPRQPNRLYRNRGDGTFEEVTALAGLEGTGFSSAATAGDFDNDGATDLYVVNAGKNHLYRNRGDGTFEEVTDRAGVGNLGTGVSAVFIDADLDGWLDLFVANYLTYIPENQSEQNPGAYPGPLAYAGEACVFYHNRGDGTFEDRTRESGLYSPGNRAMSVSAFDANDDGYPDLYVSNDDTPNQMWLNDGTGHFKELAAHAGVAFNSIGEAPGSMNAAIAYLNGDSLPDLFITRLGYGSLYLSNVKGIYDDRMWESGLGRLTQKYVGWGGAFLDFDNDGDADLAIANGDAFNLEGTFPLLLENTGKAHFVDASAKAGRSFQTRINGRGNAVIDFDNDGRLDLLFTALADRPFLLRNRCPLTHHWLTVQFEGARSNRSGYHAKAVLTAGGHAFPAEALCPTGFLSQGDARVHFGLGILTNVDQIVVRWPRGVVQTIKNPAIDQIMQIREPSI